MTPQKLWVLKAHTTTYKIDDCCQNIRQDFDIYRNIDNRKANKLKKETNEKRIIHANKQAIKQISKRTNKETKKTNKQRRLFFFWSDAMAGAIACGQTKQTKRKQASNHANQHQLMDFTCRNRPAPQAKKLKKKQRKKEQLTHKQATKQINKRANRGTNTIRQCRLFLFGPMQWLEPLRAAKRNK